MERILFMRFPEGKAKAFTLSYDDGVDLDERLVALFDKHSLKATFNINSGLYAAEDATYPEGEYFRRLPTSRVLALYSKNGHEVATHGHTHPWLEQLSVGSITYEIMKDREALEEQFGCIVRGHAYPFGTFNDTVVEALRACGIVYARTTATTGRFDIPTDWLRMPATCKHTDPKLMELARKFADMKVTKDSAKLFYVWGHTYEFEGDDNWNVIEEFAEFLARKSKICETPEERRIFWRDY